MFVCAGHTLVELVVDSRVLLQSVVKVDLIGGGRLACIHDHLYEYMHTYIHTYTTNTVLLPLVGRKQNKTNYITRFLYHTTE